MLPVYHMIQPSRLKNTSTAPEYISKSPKSRPRSRSRAKMPVSSAPVPAASISTANARASRHRPNPEAPMGYWGRLVDSSTLVLGLKESTTETRNRDHTEDLEGQLWTGGREEETRAEGQVTEGSTKKKGRRESVHGPQKPWSVVLRGTA